jgi:hypothetical protein
MTQSRSDSQARRGLRGSFGGVRETVIGAGGLAPADTPPSTAAVPAGNLVAA